MVSGLFEKKRDAIPPHPGPPQALFLNVHGFDAGRFIIEKYVYSSLKYTYIFLPLRSVLFVIS
jgi:hypothetical protein